LYERLDQLIKGGANKSEIQTIIDCLRMRSGAYGVHRKQMINNLFKAIVELSFPNYVKYLFWETENNEGVIFQDRKQDSDPNDSSMMDQEEDESEKKHRKSKYRQDKKESK